MKWSCGVTTCPARRKDLLPQTLASLAAAGFDRPHLFIDGAKDRWEEIALDQTLRFPAVRTAGNWVLSLYELYYREPSHDRFALFQDDFVCCKGLRAYLDATCKEDKAYWNLYTFPQNQELSKGPGWFPSKELKPGFQTGRGALGLVFSREGVVTLLSSSELAGRPQDCHRGWRAIDGGIVHAMNVAGWRELVHDPSLTQHTGEVSSMGNRPHRKAESFRGEGWDVLSLLETPAAAAPEGGLE